MRKVRMMRSVAGRRATYTKGDEIDVPDHIASSLLAAGHAQDITPDDEGDDEGDELRRLKKKDLVALADERGVDSSGTKDELVERIRESRAAESQEQEAPPEGDGS